MGNKEGQIIRLTSSSLQRGQYSKALWGYCVEYADAVASAFIIFRQMPDYRVTGGAHHSQVRSSAQRGDPG